MSTAAEGFRRRVGQALTALLSCDSWLLTEDEDSYHRVHAGGFGAVSWYQRTANGPAPIVYVSNGMALIEDYLAIPSLGWQGSLTRLQKVMGGGGWVRLSLGTVITRDPGVLPALWAGRSVSLPEANDITELDSEPGFHCYQAHDERGRPSVWQFPTDHPGVSITWTYGWTRLDFPGVACPFAPPKPAEVMDAETIIFKNKRTARLKRPRPPIGYQVQIEESEGEDDRYPWTLRDPDLAQALQEPNCVEAQETVRQALRVSGKKLDGAIVFDSEINCFFAYARTTSSA